MDLPQPLQQGVLLRRYKRFLADIRLDDGTEITAHCPNPGAMTSCAIEGGRVLVSHHTDPRRKLAWTWQLAWGGDDGRAEILINTHLANAVIAEGIDQQAIPALSGYANLRREAPFRPDHKGRVDILLSDPSPDRGGPALCYVEIKSVSLAVGGGIAAFPDSRTKRGLAHLQELMGVHRAGHRAVQLFFVARTDITSMRPADEIDPAYADALTEAHAEGVEVMAVQARVEGAAVYCGGAVPVDLSRP